MKKLARLLYGATDGGAPYFSADILWRTGFRVPDPLFLVEITGKTFLCASPLEAGRAEKEADVDHVVRITGNARAAITDFLKARGIRSVKVPGSFPYGVAKSMEKNFTVVIAEEPWYPERAIKTAAEIREIEKAQRATERAFSAAITFLRACNIKRHGVYHGNRPATSEMVRAIIDHALWHDGYLAMGTIVASGTQAADPHCIGRGVLSARVPIVIDIFPASLATHYYADMTRTVFKGKPAKDYVRMYEHVRKAQENAIKKIRPGADGRRIYNEVREYFSAEGYRTTIDGKRAEGFIHGLGHGVGIDIHEHPRLGSEAEILEKGNVVTVEPGLYYPRVGGIRIEDMVLITATGCKNLTRAPKSLATAIIP